MFQLQITGPSGKPYDGPKSESAADLAQCARKRAFRSWRVFKADRKRLKSGELAAGRRGNSKHVPPRDLVDLAKDAARYYRARDIKEILVFPLGKSENAIANQFRKHLAAELCQSKSKRSLSNRVRTIEESAAEDQGYTFVEIDPSDYL